MSTARLAPLPRKCLEEAADWWARIQDADAANEEISAWLEWLDAVPQNREAFERIQQLSLRLKATQRAASSSASLRCASRVRWLAAAAVLIVAIGAALFVRFDASSTPRPLTFSTNVAAFEQAPLPDGSMMSLGGATAVEARYDPAARVIRLDEGEAYFEVRHELTRRPFIVNAGPISIRALGTAFNVRKTHERIAVTVTAGKVSIANSAQRSADVQLAAGEQALYDPQIGRMRIALVDPQRALAWRERRLEFVDEPLDTVIANINRYSPRHIDVRDVDLHSYSYTGTFHADILDEWLIAIERSFPVAIHAHGDDIVITRRR
jgi:transmembrane sensor